MQTKERLEELIAEAQSYYYNLSPIISDAEYDTLIEELRELDPDNALLKAVGAPALEDSRLQKVAHVIPMGSLSKVNTQDEFSKWAAAKGVKFILQPKFDGISISLKYAKGKLVQAVTRGSGTEGEDVTHNLTRCLKDLHASFTGYLRGEVVILKDVFEANFADTMANPRNAASGITRRLSGEGAEHLTVKIYDVVAEDTEFATEKAKVDFIKALGFPTDEFKLVGVENAIKWYDFYTAEGREKLNYEIDGLVLKMNDLEAAQDLGDVDGRPRSQVAWKFAPEMKRTTLRDILWQVGNSGRVTPVAVFDSVKVAGVTISRASLHNWANVEKLKIGKGAEILISRRNDVIPYVEMCVKVGEPSCPPSSCPTCNSGLLFEGEYLTCPNFLCSSRLIGNLKKWIKVLDIEECGDAFLTDVMAKCGVSDVADLYTLDVSELLTLEGYQETKATKIVANIRKKTNLLLEEFCAGLNIPNASLSTFTMLKKAGINSIEKLSSVELSSLESIPGIGEITAQVIVDAFRDPTLISLINKLLKVGITIKEDVKGKLTGSSFCFTGEISIKRPDAMKLVKNLGGEVKSSVSKGLTYLVQANPQSVSSKSTKALKYGTKVIGEREFLDLVDFSFEKLLE